MTANRILICGAISVMLAGAASAQDSLQTAKDFYASAAYEDALNVLSRLPGSDAAAEAQQYRVFCLIALGRLAEAERAIESVVSANPRYVPSASDVSPRIQEVFARIRKQVLPGIARQTYAEAKRAFDGKDRDAAIAGFGNVVEIIDGAGAETRQSLDDLRLLAAGFLDLSKALSPPRADPPAAPDNGAAAAPAPPAEVPLDITRPFAIRQVMPPWMPSDPASRLLVFTGAIRVRISASGRVESAEMARTVHPVYDRLLLQAAKDWVYEPARRGGVPIASEQLVEVQLKPR